MAGYPVVLHGEILRALVVGGGAVAERRARALVSAGATVRVVAPAFSLWFHAAAAVEGRLTLTERPYTSGDIGDAQLVIAATDRRDVNERVAAEALELNRLVNVVDAPAEGNFITAAVHRTGPLVLAVTAGGVPPAAARIRDALATRFDERYADAIRVLALLRDRLLADGNHQAWRRAVDELVGANFCDAVEQGTFRAQAAAWR